jgi:phosphatidylinositol alpha-1,6-mannosyltransferase
VVRFPLGLSKVRTPAGSPLPGHILAQLGPTGRMASLVLFGLSGLAVCVWLLVRPPRDARSACDRLAIGVALAFLLAPAGRFGYLQLPVLLAMWPRLALWTRQLSGAPVLVASSADRMSVVGTVHASASVHGAQADDSVHKCESVRADHAMQPADAGRVEAAERNNRAELSDHAERAERAASAAARS